MKKTYLTLFSLLLAIPGFARNFTYTNDGQTLTYQVISESDHTVSVGLRGEGSEDLEITKSFLEIPAYVPDNNWTSFKVVAIRDAAFSSCDELTSVIIPETVTSIGEIAFSGCSNLQYVSLSDSLDEIGFLAFNECSGLTSIAIPNSVTKIGASAFKNCTGLTSISIGSSVVSIGQEAFSYCNKLTDIEIPNSVNEMGNFVFAYCDNLNSVKIGNSVTSIGMGAFMECRELTSITIPESVKSIGDWGLGYCCSISSITFPGSIASIGDSSFYGCSGLTKVSIPKSVTSIGEGAFSNCSSLNEIIVEEGNGSYCSVDGVLFNKEKTLLHTCPGNYKGDYEIPSSVTALAGRSFYGCSRLNNVEIPETITALPNSVFWGCSGISSFTIPSSINEIGWYAFSECTGLNSIFYNSTNPVAGDQSVFWCKDDIIYNSATLYVPESSMETFKTIDPWMQFKNIKAYDFNTSIGEIPNSDFKITVDCSKVIVSGLNSNETVSLYDLNGVSYNAEAGNRNEVCFNVSSGIYIIKTGGIRQKIIIP